MPIDPHPFELALKEVYFPAVKGELQRIVDELVVKARADLDREIHRLVQDVTVEIMRCVDVTRYKDRLEVIVRYPRPEARQNNAD